jgi:heterodisulfide reductase subunit C
MAAKYAGESITTILNEATDTGAWSCSNCWKCEESCPIGVDVYEMMMEKRRQEEAPVRYRKAYESICATGYSMPVDEINTIREMWGLKKIRLTDPTKVRRLLEDEESES